MTDQKITFNALDSYFLNTGNNKLNVGYMLDCVFNIFDIEYRHTNGGGGKSKLYYVLTNRRRKNPALIGEAFLIFANHAIENDYYPKPYTATMRQLTNYLKRYGYDWTVFGPLSKEIDRMREELF